MVRTLHTTARRSALLIALIAGMLCLTPPLASARQTADGSRASQSIARSDESQREKKQRAKQLARYTIYIVLILLIFVTGTWAIVRFSRRYKRYLLRPTTPPSQSEDVWAMHRVPEEFMPPAGPDQDDTR